MSNKKPEQGVAKPEAKKSAPPPIKEGNKDIQQKSFFQKLKDNKKTLLIIIPIIIAVIAVSVILAVVLKNSSKGPSVEEYTRGPIYVTDENGIAVTDENGMAVTIEAVTTVVKVTDKDGNVIKDQNGKPVTTVVYKDVNYTYYVPVTDKNGTPVTDKNGVPVTEKATLVQDPNLQNGALVMGTTILNITDGAGNTALDHNGNPLTTIGTITSNPVTVAPATLEWKASLGGTEADYFSCIDSLKDGYIAINVTNSTNGNMTEFADLKYVTPYSVIAKYNDDGDVVWKKAIGSKRGAHIFKDVITLDDGSFYAIGYAENPGGKAGEGYYDGIIYKYDKKGNEVWHKSFGTSTVDLFNAAALTSDGGIVVAGTVGNNDGDAEGFGKPELKTAAVIVKYSSDGQLVWKNIVGGNKDNFVDIAVGKDESIFCLANLASNEFFKNRGKTDSALIKFTAKGKYVAAAPIAGTGADVFSGLTACKNGGLVMVGRSNSNDSDSNTSFFVGDLGSRGGFDAYIVKFSEDLTLNFAKPFRGQYDDNLVDIVEKEDGSFVATGCSNSSTRDFKGITTRGGDDIVIASFDRYGNLSWAHSFGGTANESAEAICLSDKGGYVIAGRTLSKNIDMVGIAQYVNGKDVGVIAKFPE